MGKNHQQHPHQPVLPVRPTQAPTPRQDAPVLTSVALGRTSDGKWAAALLRTQGLTLVSCGLLCPPTKDAASAEEAWRVASYGVLYHGEAPATHSGTLVSGTGLSLVKGDRAHHVRRVEIEDGKVLPYVPPNPLAPTSEEKKGDELYVGTKLDAWHELSDHADRHLLRESLMERRRRAAGA